MAMAATLVAATPVLADDLGKGGSSGKGGSNGSTGSSGSSGGKGGGVKPPPQNPPRNNGGSTGSGSSGGRGGGNTSPPVRTNSGGGSTGGKGGGSTPPRNSGGSTGSSNSGGRGGSTTPPVRTNSGGSSQSGGKGGSSSPPIRTSGGGTSSGGRTTVGSGNQNWSGGRQTTSSSNSGLGKGNSGASRSGSVSYGSVNNARPSGDRNRNQSYSAPKFGGNGSIAREARRSDIIVRNDNRYRHGYNHYDHRWVDDNFCYPHYRFTYSNDCYPSPFYYYNHLPAYIFQARIQIGGITFDFRSGERYRWREIRYDDWGRNDWGRGDQYEIDLTVGDIREAFRRGSVRFMSNLISRDGRITTELEDDGRYTMRSDDFYDLMRDLVEGTYTTDYRIEDVRVNRNQLTIVAEHVYQSSWGGTERTYHTYGLERYRNGYEIVFFRTDRHLWRR